MNTKKLRIAVIIVILVVLLLLAVDRGRKVQSRKYDNQISAFAEYLVDSGEITTGDWKCAITDLNKDQKPELFLNDEAMGTLELFFVDSADSSVKAYKTNAVIDEIQTFENIEKGAEVKDGINYYYWMDCTNKKGDIQKLILYINGFQELAGSVIATGEDNDGVVKYYDMNGSPFSKEAFENAYENYFEGEKQTDVKMKWIDLTENVTGETLEKKLRESAESWNSTDFR